MRKGRLLLSSSVELGSDEKRRDLMSRERGNKWELR
jgi:hypothetical protein